MVRGCGSFDASHINHPRVGTATNPYRIDSSLNVPSSCVQVGLSGRFLRDANPTGRALPIPVTPSQRESAMGVQIGKRRGGPIGTRGIP